MNRSVSELIEMIKKSVSPYHTAAYCSDVLASAGFEGLELGKQWNIKRGGRYFLDCFGSMFVAFTVGADFDKSSSVIKISAAHGDWPCLKIKPSPEISSSGYCKLNIEAYGGMIFNTWFDRPLSAAGIVSVLRDDKVESKLVDLSDPVLYIPNLAIHLNREVNKGAEINPQRDMQPICAAVADNWEREGYFVKKLAEAIDVSPESILSYDICVYNPQEPTLVGFDKNMLSAPRLDNIASASACIDGIKSTVCKDDICVAVIYDNEEVGSKSKQGAASAMLSNVIEKITLSLDMNRSEYIDLLNRGMLLSCDGAHAIHPARPELYDASCHSYMNRGVTLKMNFNQRYPTDATAIARIKALCIGSDIPYQQFMNRADMVGGGTIGADASSLLGITAVDVGVPMLAMHSSTEIMGAEDQVALCRLVSEFYNR